MKTMKIPPLPSLEYFAACIYMEVNKKKHIQNPILAEGDCIKFPHINFNKGKSFCKTPFQIGPDLGTDL